MILKLSYKGVHRGFMRISPRTMALPRHDVELDGSGVEFSFSGENWFSYEEGLCENGMSMRWDKVVLK